LTNHVHETDAGGPNPSRHVELDIDIGADAKDWSAIQAGEKLQPVETELRRIEEMVAEVVAELDYLRIREQKLRDTNESTNERVKWFAFGTMGMLVGLGAWQIVYLRAYFRFVIAACSQPSQAYTIPQIQAPHLDEMDGIMHFMSFQVGELRLCYVQQWFIGTVSAITASPPFVCLSPSSPYLACHEQQQTRPSSRLNSNP
jgi:hypothetical protein